MDQLETVDEHPSSDDRHLIVEGLEHHRVGMTPLFAQQSVSLSYHPLVLAEISTDGRGQSRSEVVEVLAAQCRPSFDEIEIVWEKGHEWNGRCDIRKPLGPLAIHQYAPATRSRELHLDPQFAGVVCKATPDDGAIAIGSHQSEVRSTAETLHGGQIGNGLEDVRLAGAVFADEHVQARVGSPVDAVVRSVGPQLQPVEYHDVASATDGASVIDGRASRGTGSHCRRFP